MFVREGFPGQRLRVMPASLTEAALRRPVTSRLLVTDCGYFPHAAAHGRTRGHGSDQAIVIVCSEGRGWVRLPGGNHSLQPGNAIVIPPGTPHAYGADDSDPWSIWWLHVTGSDVAGLVEATESGADRPLIRLRDPFRTIGLIDETIGYLETDESTPNLIGASGAAWHLLATLAADRMHPADRGDPIAQALEYLRDRVGDRTSVRELAVLARLSTSHFASLFSAATGHGVLAYQTSLRMSRARELLDQTEDPITSIARAVGYADSLYFSRQFSRHHGVSPSVYRATTKG
jgi:AraC family transcriptional regulator of arabinose operon